MNNKYWWVNHKKTLTQEISGSYIWSPKKNKNNARNKTYENLEKCVPGDIVYSYAFKKISYVGIIDSKAITTSKPNEFGNTGQNWDREGWLVKVNWQPLKNPFQPKEVFDQIKDYLPDTHSPLNKLGNGSEGCYLGDINQTLGDKIMKFIKELNSNIELDISFLEDEILRTKTYLEDIKACEKIENITEKEALIKARLGHGQFRRDVEMIEPVCRVTGLDKKEFLIASHIKSWKDSDNFERLDGSNGLLLSPHIDKLFDRHWISFTKEGKLIWKSKMAKLALEKWGIKECKILKPLSSKQEFYMNYHRSHLKD